VIIWNRKPLMRFYLARARSLGGVPNRNTDSNSSSLVMCVSESAETSSQMLFTCRCVGAVGFSC
jgi:hypothetical protein